MPAPFSRLQLAAALIEYDNDPDDPYAPKKSAQQSAIFAHFRRNPAARPDVRVRHSNHLGVALATDNEDGRGSAMGTRRSRGSRNSLDALRNPFGTDSLYDDEQEEEDAEPDMEVDLSSWGLEELIPQEKTKSKGKLKSPAPTLAVVRSRTISGGPNEFGEIPGPVGQTKSLSSFNTRRQSTSSRLELGDNASQDPHQQRRRAASQSTIPPLNEEGGVPFPSGRSHSPGYDQIGSPQETHHLPRSHSRASIGSRGLLDGFDDPLLQEEDPEQSENPFALQPPTVTSRFDPKAQQVHARTISQGSLGSRGLLDNFDAVSAKSHDSDPRDRPYSVVELLRPKVLVMPSPLQPVGPQTSEENKVRDGFQMSRDGPPLPPGARPMSRRLSSTLDNIPVPSNSFIPNSTADLSYSQKLFRNTLVAGASGGDSEALLPRAVEDGEQIQFEAPIVPEEEMQLQGANLPKPTGRPAGKLYGKSLIDDLESRKQQMRNKQRVFTGDQRPSMMARNNTRSSTLIDPATLNDPPANKRTSTFDSLGSQNALGRRNSFKPLLNFDDDKLSPPQAVPDRIAKNRSVFGVDTLWEKEMVKLRELQEEERIEEEARRKAEEEEARLKAVKDKKKKKRKKKGMAEEDEEEAGGGDRLALEAPAEPRVSIEPPVLPDIIKPTPRRAVPKVEDDESSEDSDDDAQVPRQNVDTTGAWHSDSEDEGPRRTTGVGLRNPKQVKQKVMRQGSDSEEDLPLTVAMQRVQTRGPQQFGVDDDSDDEDKPLAQVLREPKPKSSYLDINFDSLNMGAQQAGSDDEDEQPLGLRASRMVLNRGTNEDDDDKPLAFHPEQQRRTQFQMFAAAQQQQQQQQQQQAIMMQAQFQNSMFFNQPMMTGPYFSPQPMMGPMNPMAMMQPPMPIPSPPPLHDQAKYMSVDRWRRDVAIDGER